MIADPEIAIEYSTIAFTIDDLGTKPGSMACLAGMSKASKIPVTNEIANNIMGVIAPKLMSTAVSRHNNAMRNLVIIIRTLLFTRSAKTPPQIERNNIGPKPQAVTKPNIYSSGVRTCISQSLPNTNDHIPRHENRPPNQNNLYCLKLKEESEVNETPRTFRGLGGALSIVFPKPIEKKPSMGLRVMHQGYITYIVRS